MVMIFIWSEERHKPTFKTFHRGAVYYFILFVRIWASRNQAYSEQLIPNNINRQTQQHWSKP